MRQSVDREAVKEWIQNDKRFHAETQNDKRFHAETQRRTAESAKKSGKRIP
jgi:hypothetical protein